MNINPIFLKDYYKCGHVQQYPKGTTLIFNNFTPRKSLMKDVNHSVFFGLQYFIKHYLQNQFNDLFFNGYSSPLLAANQYSEFLFHTLGKQNKFPSHIGALQHLGYLPIAIYALPELSVVPCGVPAMVMFNTHPDFYWLPNMLETLLSCTLWQSCTSATIAREYRLLLDKYAQDTSDIPEFVDYQAHDFSMRGMSSVESACLSGMAHLQYFKGTDTIPAMMFNQEYYNKPLHICSVPATEHSVMSAGGKEDEYETYRRLIEDVYPNGIISLVSDTWSLWHVVSEYLPRLKDIIMARDGKVVIRPDCYDEATMILTNSGWKFFNDLTDDDLVAQVLPDHTYEFVNPLKKTKQAYNGWMVEFKDHHGKCDLLVTPNHRMLWKRRKTGDRVVEAAQSFVGTVESKMYRSAQAQDKNRFLAPLERLKIAFQADGSFKTSSDGIRFSFSKQRKIDRLEAILKDCELSYKIYPLQDGRFEFNINADASLFKKDFSWVDSADLCSHWCKEFIEEMSYWDATRRSDGRFKFDSTNKLVIDTAELIAIGAGYGALTSWAQDDREDHFNDVYTLHIMKDNLIGSQAITKKWEWYTGNIHCVTVPSGMLLVKRNRATAVCGNSGDPADILCGTQKGQHVCSRNFDYAGKGLIECLWDIFGGTINSKGYKQLDPHIGAIYGDSITLDRARNICERLQAKGFASTNIVFGIGSFSYQYNTRDTLGWAVKATYAEINGEGRAITKDPITDNGTKKSHSGLLKVVCDIPQPGFPYKVLQNQNWHEFHAPDNELKLVFKDGKNYG